MPAALPLSAVLALHFLAAACFAAPAAAAAGAARDDVAGAGIVGSGLCPAATVARRAADEICSGDAVAAALHRVGLVSHTADAIDDHMATLELRTALDLRLLAGTPEAEDLFASLTNNGVSIGARAKVRLLVASGAAPNGAACMPAMSGGCQQPARHQMGVPSRMRKLQQESQQTGLSLDSVAIVISVLLGIAGYMVQAWSARRAEMASMEQQRESAASLAQVQREHQRTLVQIARTERWIDDCVYPILQSLYVYQRTRFHFVCLAAVELQREQPETFAQLYSESYSMKHIAQDADGVTWVRGNGWKVLDPHRPKSTTEMAEDNLRVMIHSSPTVESIDITMSDTYFVHGVPYCGWLPTIILDMLSSNPDSALAQKYRSHIRCEVLPRIRQITNIIATAQGAVIELPANDWLYEKFPNEYGGNKADVFASQLIMGTLAWEATILDWDEGRLSELVPKNTMIPYKGLRHVMLWSFEHGEARMEELVGMTSNRAVAAKHANVRKLGELV